MTSAEFIYLCKTFGDQSLPENERWKSIKYVHADCHPLFDIHDLYKQKCCYFINTDEFTGFVIREQTLPEFQIKTDPVLTFIDANCIFSVSFLDTVGSSSMAEIQKILGENQNITIEFAKTSYEVKSVNEIAFSISDVNADSYVKTKFFETEPLANAATSPDDPNALTSSEISKNKEYYLKAFALSPYSGYSSAIPVTIISDGGINDITYKFVDDDGTVLKTATVTRGTKIQAPENPTKASTAQYSYTFAGWDGYTNGMTAEKNIVFTAKYNETVNKYKYTFYDDDGTTILKEITAEYGTSITPPANPTKSSTAQYTYTFSKWNGYTSGMILTGNVTFKAVYTSTIRQYTYTFYDEDGKTKLKETTANYGTAITAPSTPTKASTAQYTYAFSKWDGYTTGMIITSNVTFTAVYTSTVNKYSYTFYDDDNKTVLKTDTVNYGTSITPPANPTKASTAQYTYAFSKWDGYTTGMIITSNVTFTAKYTSVTNKYTYTFYDEDGKTKLKETTAEYGTSITPPANPTKSSTAQYTYTFSKWDGYTTGMTLTNNVTFTAKYTSVTNKYTYTFYDEDGTTVLKTDTVNYGTSITPPANPTKSSTAQYTYTFSKWDGYTTGMTLTNNVTFTAVYTSTIRQYTYTFYDEDGTTVLKTDTVDYGTTIIAPAEDPTKEATETATYEFAGYDGFTEGMTITDDIEFTAVYTETPITV